MSLILVALSASVALTGAPDDCTTYRPFSDCVVWSLRRILSFVASSTQSTVCQFAYADARVPLVVVATLAAFLTLDSHFRLRISQSTYDLIATSPAADGVPKFCCVFVMDADLICLHPSISVTAIFI